MLVLLFAGIACAQKSSDPNKFAIIINGAGGEAVYAKQFEEWTGQLSSVLSTKFGFDSKQLTVLKGATAEDVKRTFTTLKTQLEANKQAFVLAFVQRADFLAAFPNSMTAQQFVDKLYQNAGIAPDSAPNHTAALNELNLAPADNAARARTLRLVAEDPMLIQREFNRAFVLMEYFGYLQRNPPDAPERTLDYQGYNFWLDKLNQFNGNYINAEMVKAFLSSIEYRQRFGQ